MNWICFKEKVPPYDTLVLLKGESEYGCPVYAIAYNECYQPNCSMTCIFDGIEFPKDVVLPVYNRPSFQPTHWITIE